jgi:hypothetical protein
MDNQAKNEKLQTLLRAKFFGAQLGVVTIHDPKWTVPIPRTFLRQKLITGFRREGLVFCKGDDWL